jgi:pimeloyl-ACP methyl ester carboxylesterase
MQRHPHPRVIPSLAFFFAALSCCPAIAHTADDYAPFEGEKTTWHDGFDRFDFVMDEQTLDITPFKRPEGEGFGVRAPDKGRRRCIVIVPKKPAPGNPWSWRGQYWDHEPQAEVELLRRGFHVAFVTPDPGKPWEAWYAYLTGKHGLSKKPAFVGMSRGGVNAYDWAVAHPDKVSCIYADNPAIRPEALARLGDLARNDVALMNVCGSQDFLLQRHTLAIEARYHELGGRITVMIKDGPAHHPHSLRDPGPIADWIVEHSRPSRDRPAFADASFAKSYYYALGSTYTFLQREGTYATCRGPGFTECYDRYDAKTGSPWGLAGVAVIVPKAVALGKPWVFRADPIGRDATVDQALLGEGFHIVVAPHIAQAGPVRGQWDELYQKLVGHGFSRKPVMEGAGTASGEAYAWAIANPDKVSCVYGENPALRSLMTKESPLDHLESLARAGVPLIHACGSLDPWFDGQTRVAERRYKDLGGRMTVIVDEGKGHYPPALRDPKPVVDLILACQKELHSHASPKPRDYRFDGTISREVLENYLSRAISMEGLLNGRGDLDDNIRMLKEVGAKFIGRALCLWGGEADLLRNLGRAKDQVPRVHAADPEMVLQACIFEIVTTQVERVPVPEWAFVALGRPVETRNFRYTDMLYPDGRRVDHWRRGQSVPDVSRPETKLWFYFLAASYIDLGIEAIHFGQTELMNGNDRDLAHYSEVLALIRAYAAKHARRHMVLCDSHVPSGGLVRDRRLLMDFHSFPLRIKEVPDRPQEAVLEAGFSDGIYGRSKGGTAPSGWSCEHLPYLVEIDNWGASRRPGQAKQGGIWVWGYDEITWFAHQPEGYRATWLRYARNWVRKTDPNGHLQMPGSRTVRSPRDGRRWYYANRPSVAVPDGLGDEAAIRAIWAAESER